MSTWRCGCHDNLPLLLCLSLRLVIRLNFFWAHPLACLQPLKNQSLLIMNLFRDLSPVFALLGNFIHLILGNVPFVMSACPLWQEWRMHLCVCNGKRENIYHFLLTQDSSSQVNLKSPGSWGSEGPCDGTLGQWWCHQVYFTPCLFRLCFLWPWLHPRKNSDCSLLVLGRLLSAPGGPPSYFRQSRCYNQVP